MNAVIARWANTLSRLRRAEWGGVGIREMIALLAVAITILAGTTAILAVAGFDVGEWLQEQFGNAG